MLRKLLKERNYSRAETIRGNTVWKLPRWPTFLRWNLSHANGWQCGKPFHGHRRINLAHDCSLSTHGIRRMLTRLRKGEKKGQVLWHFISDHDITVYTSACFHEKKRWIFKNFSNNHIMPCLYICLFFCQNIRCINLAHDCSLSTHGIRRMLTRLRKGEKKGQVLWHFISDHDITVYTSACFHEKKKVNF